MDGMEDDFLKEIEAVDVEGDIHLLQDTQAYDDIIQERFRWDMGRIQWPYMPEELWEMKRADDEDREGSIRHFLASVQPRLHIADDCPIIFLGDNMDATALHMTWETLLAHCGVLFSWPQHHFVIPRDGAWCFNYTFADYMFFGVADDRPR